MAKKNQTPPKEETKAQCFKRVVSPRVGKAIKAIRLVGSVTGSSYEHNDSQVASISVALQSAVNDAIERLDGKGESKSLFNL